MQVSGESELRLISNYGFNLGYSLLILLLISINFYASILVAYSWMNDVINLLSFGVLVCRLTLCNLTQTHNQSYRILIMFN